MYDDTKVSVLMSVYVNENQDHLRRAINSILEKQTQKPDEFVLVCDGPLTESLEAVIDSYYKQYQDKFKIVRMEENQGLGKALCYGLSNCSNEIIIRADSDDICIPERIEIQVNYLEEHLEIAAVSSYVDEFDEDWNAPKNLKTLPLEPKQLAKMVKFRNPLNHMAVAFRKSAVLDVGSYRHRPCIEDYDLWARLVAKGYRLANIDKVLVHARVGNGMIERRSNKQYITSWRMLNKDMLSAKMINGAEYIRNMFAIRCFIYMPKGMKELLYKCVLRKES